MQLDCNRATGSWRTEAAGDGIIGALELGPLAAARARCRPLHLDEKIVRDRPFAQDFIIRDGNLYLGLMADAGICAREPLE